MALIETLHIAAAMLWLGNFVVTGVWSIRAFCGRDGTLRRFAVREIIFTDLIFTFGGGAAVVMSGLALAHVEHIDALATMWTRDALAVAIGSGVIWLAVLVPLEIRMQRLAQQDLERPLVRAFVLWNVIGWLVSLALFAVIYLMVAKPV